MTKHSEGYDVRTSDGLGRAVDGHVHAYDTIHNVSWVDFFELEPRRGLGNLAALPIAPVGGTCPDGSTGVYDDSDTPLLLGCVETIESQSDLGHLIEDGRVQNRMPVVSRFSPALVVGHHQDDIGPGRGGNDFVARRRQPK